MKRGGKRHLTGPGQGLRVLGGSLNPPIHKRLTGPEAVRVGAMTALRLELVGAGHPCPCGTAPGRSEVLGGGAAPASPARVRAVLLNALLRDFRDDAWGGPRVSQVGAQDPSGRFL